MIRRFVIWLLVLLLVAQSGCRGCNDDPRERIPMLADAAPPPSLTGEDKAPPASFRQDPLWRVAMEAADDMDLASLADREGASGLLEGFEHGGKVARTALSAMPFAPDAPVAYRRLAEVALLTKGEAQRAVIQSLHDSALQPRRVYEPIDEGGREACVDALMRIAGDEDAPRANRALAVSTLRLPPFVDLVSPDRMPSALDSPAAASSSG